MTELTSNTMLWPFFTFFGGKWRCAKKYPPPAHDIIIEPFAGAAGYSLRHPEKKILLCEKDPVIAALWRYLITSSPKDILELPDIPMDSQLKDIDLPSEAKSLIGFWLNKGTVRPSNRPSSWMRSRVRPKSYWGPEIRSRIAEQLPRISHWQIHEGSYQTLDTGIEATWFVDPPYQYAGKHYICGSKDIDYVFLAAWCKSLIGQVMVCETKEAIWLPFQPFSIIKASPAKYGGKSSTEVLWQQK